MVIACEECQTRFHVEDARIPAEGIRVRCSRCKHAFFVRSPSAGDDAAWAAVAEQAMTAPAAPPPTHDLTEGATGETSTRASRFDLGASAEEGESDWQFAIEPPASSKSRQAPPTPASANEPIRAFPSLTASGPAAGAAEEPESSSLADLDSPESWDLLTDRKPRSTPSALPVASKAAPRAAAATSTAPSRTSGPVAADAASQRSTSRGPSSFVNAASFAAVAALFGLGVYGTLAASRSPAVAAPVSAPLPGLSTRGVEGRFVENARAGSLYVVSLRVAGESASATTPGRMIRVAPVDGSGERLQAPVAAGLSHPERDLREDDPTRLREALDATARVFAWTPLARDHEVLLQAVFERLPAAATGFVLESVPVARPAPPPPPPEATAVESPAADPAAGSRVAP